MDSINHPGHYTQAPIECIDAMLALFGPDALADHCLLCAFKYLWRARAKNTELENIRKAHWYLEKYISLKSPKADTASPKNTPADAKNATPGNSPIPHVRPIPPREPAVPHPDTAQQAKATTPAPHPDAETVRPEPPAVPEFFYDY